MRYHCIVPTPHNTTRHTSPSSSPSLCAAPSAENAQLKQARRLEWHALGGWNSPPTRSSCSAVEILRLITHPLPSVLALRKPAAAASSPARGRDSSVVPTTPPSAAAWQGEAPASFPAAALLLSGSSVVDDDGCSSDAGNASWWYHAALLLLPRRGPFVSAASSCFFQFEFTSCSGKAAPATASSCSRLVGLWSWAVRTRHCMPLTGTEERAGSAGVVMMCLTLLGRCGCRCLDLCKWCARAGVPPRLSFIHGALKGDPAVRLAVRSYCSSQSNPERSCGSWI